LYFVSTPTPLPLPWLPLPLLRSKVLKASDGGVWLLYRELNEAKLRASPSPAYGESAGPTLLLLPLPAPLPVTTTRDRLPLERAVAWE
jgi:hypothetical protein